MSVRPVMLVILDGFGWREESADNAVRLAKTPELSRSSGSPARTPFCIPRGATSACLTGRWAIRRSGTSTSAPAAS